MFRIESYITPIILSHIDKYVKDFRSKDAQVSLWGGEVAFQNLDLRLDVLEEELQLPFSFVSGHIHELTVLVPWTKIASEPIQITINTIEFVLKLKTGETERPTSLARKKSSAEMAAQTAAAPGYMASLINKIANNVSVKLHNIILKYVEEDIVVSMNIQLLSFDSADENWEPAFIDINPINVLIKKVIKISDLTICLDKRNSLGIIEVCQEPMLYRCSMQIRMLRRYNISSVHSTSLLRMDIFTDSIGLNITSQQYPMVMRLLILANTLREGSLKRNNLNTGGENASQSGGEDDPNLNDSSFLGWAWNMMPTLFPAEATEDEAVARKLGHILHTGIYVKKMQINFKSQELANDLISTGTKKLKYYPMQKVSLVGLYSNTITVGKKWFNASGGCSFFGVYPLGVCTCGKAHDCKAFITSADILCDHSAFLDDSLWDPKCPENAGKFRSYDRLWESHEIKVSMDELLRRTPAMAFDMFHSVDIPDDHSSTSNLSSNLEYSNLSETHLARASIGEFHLRYNSSLVHIVETLVEFSKRYNYAPYAPELPPLNRSTLPQPTEDNIEALMNEVPMRNFQITMQRPVIELHPGKHDTRSRLPFFLIELEDVQIRMTDAYYPNRLIIATCMLPESPAKLLDVCYVKYLVNFARMSLSTCYGSEHQHCNLKLSSSEWTLKKLQSPELFVHCSEPTIVTSLNMESIHVYMSNPQMMLVSGMVDSLVAHKSINEAIFGSSLIPDSKDQSIPIVDLTINRIILAVTYIKPLIGVVGSISNIHGLVYIPESIAQVGYIESHKQKAIFLADDQSHQDFLAVFLQMPDNIQGQLAQANPPILSLSIGSLQTNIDSLLIQFLAYKLRPLSRSTLFNPIEITNESISNSISTRSPPRSQNNSDRISTSSKTTPKPSTISVHTLSDNKPSLVQIFPIVPEPPTIPPSAISSKLANLHQLAKQTILQVDMKQWTIYVPDTSLRMSHRDSKLKDIIASMPNLNVSVFRMPFVHIRSSHEPSALQDPHKVRPFPVHLGKTIWTPKKDGFPWTVEMTSLGGSTIATGNEVPFLASNRTTVTFMVTMRSAEQKNAIEPAFVIHMDTTPVLLSFSENQILHLHRSLEAFGMIFKLSCKHPESDALFRPSVDRPKSPYVKQNDLKEFLGTTDTISEPSTSEGTTTMVNEFEIEPKGTQPMAEHHRSVWLQWTLAKISIVLYAGDTTTARHHRFTLELEDCITSYDQQEVYTKMKTKLGTISGVCHHRDSVSSNEEWTKNDVLGIIARNTLNDSMEGTFFELTVTKALTNNVHGKWFTWKHKKKKNTQLISTITEVMATIQSVDIKLGVESLNYFVPVINAFSCDSRTVNDAATPSETKVICVSDLPLIFFKSHGIRVFLPLPKTALPDCNVLCMKITKVLISPTAENPLMRKPVRGDIYSKAAELRILQTPGSRVEDRQYEILFSNISMSSGKWEQIRELLDPSEGTVKDAHRKNPAFDWNNLTMKPTAEVKPIFERFNLSIVYAPCIMLDAVLVCGQCIEINCLSDLMVEMKTSDVRLLLQLVTIYQTSRTRSNSTIKSPTLTKSGRNTTLKNPTLNVVSSSQQPRHNYPLTDSGIESFDVPKVHSVLSYPGVPSISESMSFKTSENQGLAITTIPYDMSFVGGIFHLKMYHNIITANEPSDDVEKDQRLPLISLTIFQPNVLISQSHIEKTSQFSLFNAVLKLGSPTSSKDDLNEFGDVIFTTYPGTANQGGIHPPLLSLKEHILPSREKHSEVSARRPIVIRFNHETLDKCLKIYQTVDFRIPTQKTFSAEPIPVEKISNKINTLKKTFFGSDRLDVFIGSADIRCECHQQKYSLQVSVESLQSRLLFTDRPQRLQFDGTLKSLMFSSGTGVILHPLSAQFTGKLTKEPWKKMPVTLLSLHSGVVDVSFGPSILLNLITAQDAFSKSANKFAYDLGLGECLEKVLVDEKKPNLMQIPTPPVENKKQANAEMDEGELYQDDLRAGAFQFIDASSTDSLPLPYQIQIMSRDGGIICWCYPQPRSMHYLQIFPVPFHIKPSARNQPKSIKCELQYYSSVHNEFLSYTQFHLSEKSIQELPLPAHRITAKVWRILVHQSYVSINGMHFMVDAEEDDYEDDEELSYSNEDQALLNNDRSASQEPDLMHLHPKALVGCIRVDSHFSAALLPNVELAVDFQHVHISLRRDRGCLNGEDTKKPNIIRQYTINAPKTSTDRQTFLKVYQRNLGVHFRFWDRKRISVQAETAVSASVLDLGYLTMVPLLEECQIKVVADNCGLRNELKIVTDTIRIRYGHMVGQTLAIGHKLWTEHEAASFVLASRYILCNCTSTPIKMGQVQTEESIFLRSNEATFYSFRSTQREQKLRISMETIDWTAQEAIQISDNEHMQTIQIRDAGELVTVTTKKVAGSHLIVTIKGQIEFRNMSESAFQIQYRVNNSLNTAEKSGRTELMIEGKTSMSIVARCDEQISPTIKLRLFNRKNWSGEVPLHKTHKNTPWLVKVPTETDQEYVSYWVRVMREDLSGMHHSQTTSPQRLLILIWPLFLLRSMLPITITATEKSTKSQYRLKCFGSEDAELEIPGTHETEHDISFDTNSYFRSKTKLSYKTIDRNKFFKNLDEKLGIDAMNSSLQEQTLVNWPSSLREEEIRCLRQYSQVERLELQFNQKPSRDLSSSLLLEVNPRCIIVNSTSCTVLLKNSDETSTVIHSNHIATPCTLTDSFTLSFVLDNKLYPTCPIYIKSPRVRAVPSYELGVDNSGSTVVKVLAPSSLSKFHLTSSLDNDLRVIFLSSHFVFVNSSSTRLNIWAFCALQRQRETIRVPDNSSSEFIGQYEAQTQSNGCSPRGVGLCTFFNLSFDPNDTNFNKLYNYFVTMRIDHNEYCVPIQLNRTIQRKCFSVPGPNGPHPLSLSVLEHGGQTFVSVYDDKVPAIRVENRTNRSMYVAQAESLDAATVPSPQKTLNDEHFEWYTTIRPGSFIWYTPPSVDAVFPEPLDQPVALLVACASGQSNGQICWSRPIPFNDTSETYLEQPYIKVSVDTSQRSVYIVIEPINQDKEFNVKDIRTKLQDPSPQSSATHSHRPAPLINHIQTTQASETAATLTTPKIQTELALNMFVNGFQFILYTDDEKHHFNKTEVMALYLDHVHVQYDERSQSAQLSVTNLQVDNTMHSAGNFDFPVLVCPQTAFKTLQDTPLPHPNAIEPFIAALQDQRSPPVCTVQLVFYEQSFDPKDIRCTLQPISAYIEDKYINVLLDVLLENIASNLVYGGDTEAPEREFVEAGQVLVPRQVTLQAQDLAQPFKVRLVRIDPVSVLLSVHTCMRMYIALDHSPLDFVAFERTNIYSLPSRFGYHLGMHYVSGALFGAGWVVGSLEILGSPSGLARSVTTGLRDFVSMPVEGFWRGPWALLVGITHGSASLIRNVTAGTVNSVTKMAASFARNLDRLTLDEEHLQRTEALRRQRPSGISDGISQGLTGLGISILGAVGGLARHPLEAQSSMAVVTGFGRGLVGAVTKPISGAAELLAMTGQGVLQTVGFNAMPTARDIYAERTGPLEPSPAKVSRKLIPDAYADDEVLFMGLATVLSAGCMCVALTQRLLVLVEMKTDRIRQIYSLERITLQTYDLDASKLTIYVDGVASDPVAGEHEFQYDRVMAFVRESCGMLPRNAVQSIDTEPLLVESDTTERNGEHIAGPEVTQLGTFSTPSAVEETALSQTFYMDPHLARYLVDYTELLQRILARRKE